MQFILHAFASYSLKLGQSTLVHHVAGIQSSGRLKQKDPAFVIRNRTVFNTARNDDEFAFLDPFVTVAEFHAEAAFHDQKHFVFVLMMVEDEFAL